MANTSTVVNAFQKYYANDGVTALGAGKLTWYLNKTTTLASIFSDPALTVPQTNPDYILDAGGRIQGNIRFAGTLSVLIEDSAGATVRTDDDNVCFTTSSSFVTWDAAVTYSAGDLVEGSGGLYYVSIVNTNLNNNPAAGASPTKWSQIKFTGLWNTNQSYLIKDVVQGSNGSMYYAISAQSGNDPISSPAQWALVSELVKDTTPQLGGNLSANSHQIQWSKGADVISATTLLVLTDGNYFDVTGSNTITSIDTTAVGNVIKLHFDAALTFTHNATDLIIPGGANIVTAAGDEVELIEYQTGDYRVTAYTKATGNAIIVSGAGIVVPRSTRTSNTILVEADRGTIVDVTANTFTQTFTSAGGLTSGWWCYYRNSGTGEITLDPNSSETIDGLTTFIMYPGETRLIQSDGTNLNSFVISGFSKDFSSSGTFTSPPGYIFYDSRAIGSGGGGGGGSKGVAGNSPWGGSGGGGGSCAQRKILASEYGTTETITIGAKGTGGALQPTNSTNGINGTNGASTTIGSLLTGYGGGLGLGGVITTGQLGGGGADVFSAANGSTGGTTYNDGGYGGFDGTAGSGKSSVWGGATGGGPGGPGLPGGGSANGGSGGGSGGLADGNDRNGGGGGAPKGAGLGGTGGNASTSTAPPNQTTLGFGGGGGYARNTATAGSTAGADAGSASGGGGGGGGENSSYDGSAGGDGGDGFVRISGVV